MRLARTLAIVVLLAMGSTGSYATSNPLRLNEIEAIISDFMDDLTAQDFEKAAKTISALGAPYDTEQFRKIIKGLDATGRPLYNDRVIDKYYGKTGKDIIYKVMSKDNAYFVRFVLHKREGDNWIVGWFAAQSEMQAPLPKVWSHVIP